MTRVVARRLIGAQCNTTSHQQHATTYRNNYNNHERQEPKSVFSPPIKIYCIPFNCNYFAPCANSYWIHRKRRQWWIAHNNIYKRRLYQSESARHSTFRPQHYCSSYDGFPIPQRFKFKLRYTLRCFTLKISSASSISRLTIREMGAFVYFHRGLHVEFVR